MNKIKKIAFVGGGHSNTLAIRSLMQKIYKGNGINNNMPKAEYYLISEAESSAYSGMIPGYICGIYGKKDSFVDLVNFSKVHGINFIKSEVKGLNPDKNSLILEDGSEFNYDILNLNVGSKTYQGNVVNGVQQYAIQTRPISNLLEEISNKEQLLITKKKDKLTIGIVGSGVAGVELSFSMKYRMKSMYNKDCDIVIFNHNPESVVPGYEMNVVNDLRRLMSERDISTIQGAKVTEVSQNSVSYTMKDKRWTKELDMVIWATGAGPQEFNYKSNLELDKRGFILVKDTLQALKYDNIFAAGDCIQLEKYKEYSNNPFPPKAGVYAVREGALLSENLHNYLTGEKLKTYTPQPSFLSLITMGDKMAFGTKFGMTFWGKWVWGMKEFIDVNFVKMFDKDLSYENTSSFDKINTTVDFSFSPEECVKKLLDSHFEEDFTIQLQIIDKLANDAKLLEEVKNIYKKREEKKKF